jgi:NADH:ubiquinone oxidoreductase subunit 3 (subunit A)
MIAMAVFLILFIGILGAYQERGRKKDARYKSGYRPGKNNAAYVAILMAILGFLATFFIKSLVKNPDDIGYFIYDENEDEK